jgi:TPR repeat protein
LPIVSLLTLVTAYYLLKGNSTTSWDREGGFTVEHGRIGVSRTLAAVVCFAAIIIFAVTDPAALAPPRLAEESQSGTTEFFDKGVAAYLAGNHQAAMEYYALDFRASRSPVTAANLCNLHLYGRDVPQNQAAALELCSFAAEHNEPNALIMLGEMYISGVGVTPDEQKAISYFRRGAEIGHVHGQFVMGLLLLESESIQDAKKAIGWFEKAHLGGHPLAKARLIEARLRVAQGTKE